MTAAPVFDKPAPTTMERRTVDWVRHEGNGSPKILPPPGVEWRSASGKTKQAGRYYTRVTTFAKAIDDINKLMAWKMRGVLVGAGQRPAYVAAAAALTLSAEDRKAADELAEKCLQAARGDDAALVGTALHTFTERLDRGEPLGFVPPQLVPLVEAYRALTAPLTFLHREVRMVCDDLETAGTPDAIGTCSIPDPDGVVEGLRIIDLKSGKVAYPGPMSIQLATYGRSDLYDPATGERTPLEGVNQRWGLIVHAQQDGEVPPGLYWLNLEHGNQGIELCRHVRSWRKVKPAEVLRPVAGYGPEDAVEGLRVEDTVVVEQPEDQAEVDANGCPATDHHGVDCPGDACRHAAAEAPRLHCVECTVDEDPAPWCDCRGDEQCRPGRACRQRAHAPEHCPTLPQEDDEAAQDGTDDPAELTALERAREAILGAVTTRDLGLLWDQSGGEWPEELVDLAADHYRDLKDQEDMAQPRAALTAALKTASAAELRELWDRWAGTPLWTDEHAAAAEARYREVAAA